MPVLTLKFKKDARKLKEYPLGKGNAVTIGRLEDNDIVIENLAVSGHHAKIDSVGDEYLLSDLKSKNGTFVNDELTTQHWLRHGDVVTIGKHILVFAYAQGESPPEKEENQMDQTMVMDTGQYKEMLAKSQQKPAHTPESEPVGVLNFLAGGEGEIELTKKLTKIGKNPQSDIVVAGLTVGQTAATISRRPDGYMLSYVTGFTKPKVNGETVKGSVNLNSSDMIEIGNAKFQFIIKE
jgi:pSer/pThr/pTyr-binding forkhead associated (FHA) protein